MISLATGVEHSSPKHFLFGLRDSYFSTIDGYEIKVLTCQWEVEACHLITAIRICKEQELDKGHVELIRNHRDFSSSSPPKCGLRLFYMFVNHNLGPQTPTIQA
jgi:hypothetical protein